MLSGKQKHDEKLLTLNLEKAIKASKAQHKPFFAWIHYYKVHNPYKCKRIKQKLFGKKTADRYDCAISDTDELVGMLIDFIKKDPELAPNTIIILSADHGEALGEHNSYFHGKNLYDVVLRVPLIVDIPGVKSQKVTQNVGLIDLVPTLLNFIGINPPRPFNGIDLAPMLCGEKPWSSLDKRILFSELMPDGEFPNNIKAVIVQHYKLIYDLGRRIWAVYDLAKDPDETRNLYGKNKISRYLKQLMTWFIHSAKHGHADPGTMIKKYVSEHAPQGIAKIDQSVGDDLLLIGYKFKGGKLKYHQHATLDLYLRPLRKLTGDWRVYIHTLGPGNLLKTWHVPFRGALPAEKWPVGKVIHIPIVMPITYLYKPGKFTVMIGMGKNKVLQPLGKVKEIKIGSFEVKNETQNGLNRVPVNGLRYPVNKLFNGHKPGRRRGNGNRSGHR